MSRSVILLLAVVANSVSSQIARADFVIGPIAFAEIVHDDGSTAVARSGSPFFRHESYDTFVLSANSQHVYIFANDLGSITVESWSTTSGVYSGAVGPSFPFPPQPWPPGFRPGYAIGEVHTRSTYPAFGGDLLFVSPYGVDQNGFCCPNKPLIHVINTGSHQLVEQIIPPSSVTSIYDFTMGPGTLGPKSRA
jgi:hypothetical protein